MSRKLIVEIIGDSSSLERSFQRSSKGAAGFNRDVEHAGRGALAASLSFHGLGRSVGFASAAFLGGAGFVSVAKASVAAASNLAEQTSKTSVVFGQSSKTVEEWSKTTSSAMGFASDQALATASSFGALLTPIGITGSAAAQQSVKLTQLGADLASFYNTSVQDALDAIKSGLVGEVEPLRRYGVLLTETRVQQEALVETGKTHASQLTASEKLLARQALIYRDTSKAQGDFTRTSGGFANQTRILSANLRQFEIILGQALLPALDDLLKKTNKWLGDAENQKRVQDDVNKSAKVGAGVVEGLASAYEDLASAWDKLPDFGKRSGLLDILPGGHKSLIELLHEPIADFTSLGLIFRGAKDAPDPGWATFFASVGALANIGNVAAKVGAVEAGAMAFDPNAVPPVVTAKVKGGGFVGRALTPRERLNVALGRNPNDTSALTELRGLDQGALDFALKQIAERRGNTTKFAEAAAKLAGDIAGINSTLAGIAAKRASDAQAARDKIAAANEKRRQAFRDILDGVDLGGSSDRLTLGQVNKAIAGRQQAAQFRALGLTSTGDALAPTRGALQASLAKVTKGLTGTILDTNANTNQLARIRKVLSGQFGALTRETRLSIASLLDALNPKGHGPLTPGGALNLAAATAGLGLSGTQRSVLRSRLAGQHLTTGGTQPLHVHTSIEIDGRQVALATTHHQVKADKRTPTQTRGRQL